MSPLLAALMLAASARAGVVAKVPGDLVAPLSSASLAPLYQSVATLLPSGPLGDGSRGQLAAYLDAGDYGPGRRPSPSTALGWTRSARRPSTRAWEPR